MHKFTLLIISFFWSVLCFSQSGNLDSTFAKDGISIVNVDSGGVGNTDFHSMVIQKDGKVVACGLKNFESIDNNFFVVVRLNGDGSVDSAFGTKGAQVTDFGTGTASATSCALQADSKIVVAGTSGHSFSSNQKGAVARYKTDGTPDSSFNINGQLLISEGTGGCSINSVAIQNDGKIILAGTAFDVNLNPLYVLLVRLKTDGTFDSSFGTNGVELSAAASLNVEQAVVIQTDGKLVVSGYAYSGQFLILARYNTNGTIDSSFATNGVRTDAFGTDIYSASGLSLQNDGKIVVAGNDNTQSTNAFALVRYTTNGNPDSTFNGNGFQTIRNNNSNAVATSITIIDDGRIAIGGYDSDYVVALYKTNGSPDSTFGNNGQTETPIGSVVTPLGPADNWMKSIQYFNGKLYGAGFGTFPNIDGVVVRYLIAEGGPLAVSLLAFKASLQNTSVLLNWKIITDKNLTRFIVERSQDGKSFSPINSIAYTGAASVSTNYSVADTHPLQGVNFYRLQLINVDGKFTYSNVVAVRISSGNLFTIFPNPAHRNLYVQATGNNENAVFKIVDGGGRIMKEIKINLDGTTSFSIDVSTLLKGIYNLVLLKDDATESRKFIKE